MPRRPEMKNLQDELLPPSFGRLIASALGSLSHLDPLFFFSVSVGAPILPVVDRFPAFFIAGLLRGQGGMHLQSRGHRGGGRVYVHGKQRSCELLQ